MDLFVSTKVFNPGLAGKSVRIQGFDVDGEHWDRLFLVKEVNGECITLVNCQGETIKDVHLENFDHAVDALKLTILEEKL